MQRPPELKSHMGGWVRFCIKEAICEFHRVLISALDLYPHLLQRLCGCCRSNTLKPLQCMGFSWHARRDPNPQPCNPQLSVPTTAMVAFANGVNIGLDQARGPRTHNQEAIKEKKPLQYKGSQ
jgi:hypothetical protein